MLRFKFTSTYIAGLYVVDQRVMADSRGSFSRMFCSKEFENIGLKKPIAQINHSITKSKGTVRGLHFQPQPEVKIVTCIKGKIFDVAVDIRVNSPTFLKWYSIELSEENKKSLYIPEGFAHGFQSLEDDCQLLYMHSEFYDPDKESAVNYLDPEISISWPLNIKHVSERDKTHPLIDLNFFKGY